MLHAGPTWLQIAWAARHHPNCTLAVTRTGYLVVSAWLGSVRKGDQRSAARGCCSIRARQLPSNNDSAALGGDSMDDEFGSLYGTGADDGAGSGAGAAPAVDAAAAAPAGGDEDDLFLQLYGEAAPEPEPERQPLPQAPAAGGLRWWDHMRARERNLPGGCSLCHQQARLQASQLSPNTPLGSLCCRTRASPCRRHTRGRRSGGGSGGCVRCSSGGGLGARGLGGASGGG